MARIYSLAKELKLDSKELVELCTKAGITGKGSALASLTDEEVAKLKAYLAGGSKPAAKPVAVATATAAPARPAGAGTGTFTRDDYIAPSGAIGNPQALPTKVEKEKPAKKAEVARSARPATPTIRVAPVPVSQAPPPPQTAEPAPQKPDIKLPADAIKAGRAGAKPLQAHLRKHEAKRKAETAQPQKPAAGAAPAALTPSAREGRAKRGRAEEAETLGGREARQLSRKRQEISRRGKRPDEDDRPSRGRRQLKRSGTNTAAPRKGKVTVSLPATVRSFSEAVGVPARNVLGKLLGLGTMATINTSLDQELLELLAVELGVEMELKHPVDAESNLLESVRTQEDDPSELAGRAPVVTFLGHVDHGKTSLLDKIIGTSVVSGESGGITQHIRAYRIERDGRPIAFVDTPGHEAFTEMRARGANVTDIAVLVVAADDGVMPQTEEAISHARAANVPIVVALNKIDLPGVDTNRIMQQLAAQELLPTEWGGDTEVVPCSAITGAGVDDLLDTLLTIAELHDYRANEHRKAYGTCLEAELHEGRGVVAKLLVQNGSLNIGDVIVCGDAYGRVKAMYDTLQARVTHDHVGPATPVNVTGLDTAPAAGEHFYAMDDIATARQIAETRQQRTRQTALGGGPVHVTLENLHERLTGDGASTLNLILRADVRGSIEAIRKEFTKLEHPEVQLKVLQATVGGITEADVHLADASDAIIIGFNVVPDEGARQLAERKGVQIRRYDIIYQVTDDLKLALEGMLKPEQRELALGRALVQRTFAISRLDTIAGCRVLSGKIERSARVRVIRENRIIGDYALDSLKREKDDAREVREGYECGMKLAGFNDLKEGDILEAYKMEEVARTL